jgi:hypothetical protein
MQIIQQQSPIGTLDAGEIGTAESANSNEAAPTGTTNAVPPPLPKRWVASRKAEIVDAVRGGFISLDDALDRYALSIDEFLMWQRALKLFGLPGLRMSKSKNVRRAANRFVDQ